MTEQTVSAKAEGAMRTIGEVSAELGFTQNVNYGFDRVRFLAPVPVGSQIRGEFILNSVRPRGDGAILGFGVRVRRDPDVEVLAADWLVLVLP